MQQALIQTTGAGAADARRTGVVCLFSGGGSAGARFRVVRAPFRERAIYPHASFSAPMRC